MRRIEAYVVGGSPDPMLHLTDSATGTFREFSWPAIANGPISSIVKGETEFFANALNVHSRR
ncbi:MAG: hypothetical protein Tsb0026_14140 [Sulfuricaulis sp.]